MMIFFILRTAQGDFQQLWLLLYQIEVEEKLPFTVVSQVRSHI